MSGTAASALVWRGAQFSAEAWAVVSAYIQERDALIAAKDAGIAALTKQRDELAQSEARYAALLARDETVAALKQREAHLRRPPVWLLKAAERHCEWPAFMHALAAALNAMDERAALEMSGGVSPPPTPK